MTISPVHTVLHFLPLAQRAAWERLGDRFSGEHAEFRWADLLAFVGVALTAAMLVVLLRWLLQMQERRKRSNEPRHLFADLCAVHHLDRRDRRRLRELAAGHQLEAASLLFVRPDYFESETLPEELADQHEHFARMARRIFAGLSPVEELPNDVLGEEVNETPRSTPVVPLPAIGLETAKSCFSVSEP